jgi:hypothetical protein
MCIAFHKDPDSMITTPPHEAVPVDYEEHTCNYQIPLIIGTQHKPHMPTTPPTKWSAYVHTLDPWEQDLIIHAKFPN